MSLTFRIDERGLGLFEPLDLEAANQQLEKLREAVVAVGDGESSVKKGGKAIKALLTKDPLFLRGYALLAEMYSESDEEDGEELANELYVQGCQEALKIMPTDFQGPLDIENGDVQCFLRCHAGFIEDLVEQGDYEAALEATDRQLAFDSEDIFERGRELGDLCILAAQTQRAEEVLLNDAQSRPSAHYSLAYLAFERGEHALAVQHIRRGCLLAPYAADLLTGRLTGPNIFWEDGPEAPDYREDLLFVEMLGGELWTKNEKAHSFLEWVSQTSVVLRERAERVALSEECFEADLDDYDKVLDKTGEDFCRIWDAIDLASSAKMVGSPRPTDDGQELFPWEVLAWHQEHLGEEEDDDCCCGHDHDDDEDCCGGGVCHEGKDN